VSRHPKQTQECHPDSPATAEDSAGAEPSGLGGARRAARPPSSIASRLLEASVFGRDRDGTEERRARAAALAKSMIDGGSAPKPRKPKVEEELRQAIYRRDALSEAIQQVRAQLEYDIVAARDVWQADLDRDEADARDRFAAAVLELEAGRAWLWRVRFLRRWLEDPARPMPAVSNPHVAQLAGRNGDPIPWDAVQSALLQEAGE
jgi:hypothetical protein